jgi:predicted Ser/Thr protein kinase
LPSSPLGTVGGWILEAKLGEGGMGVVYRARHPSMPGRAVALKVLPGESPDERSRARFEREALALAAVNDPGIVRIFGSGRDERGRPFYVMELVEGRSLAGLVHDEGTLEPLRAAAIVREVAVSVAHMHAKGILHRDLKPENVLVDGEGRTRICDFGLAWFEEAERLTKTGTLLGTPAYASPEQLLGLHDELDERADVYGLGAVLWFALVGRPPFEAPSLLALLARVQEEPAAPPSSLRPAVGPELDAVVLRALAKEPAHRYPSARTLAADLGRVLAGKAPRARPQSRIERLARASRRHRVPLALLAVALAILSGTAFFLHRSGEEAAARARRALAESFAKALAPGASAATIREQLVVLGAEDASAPELAAVKERLLCRELEERVAALPETPSLRDLTAAAEAAIAVPGSACLVGEGNGRALGDALLDQGDPELLALADRLAAARIARVPGDPSARALRAYAALARLDAPRRPLGDGDLGAPVPDAVLGDLIAARALPGAPGARAAWLLVDLLALRNVVPVASPFATAPAGDAAGTTADVRARQEADVRSALAAARSIAPSAPEASPLEEVAGYEISERALASELAVLRSDARRAPVLARLFARAGVPDALEHAAAAGAPPARVLARERADRFARPPIPATPSRVHGILDEAARLLAACQLTDEERLQGSSEVRAADRVAGRVAKRRAQIVEKLARAAELAPRSPRVLYTCGDVVLGSLAEGVFEALATHYDLGPALALTFSRADRGASRTGVSARPYSDRWETASPEEFDARLAEDIASDPIVPLLRRGGISASELRLAEEAASALARLDALAAGDDAEPDRHAAEALIRIASLARLGGPIVLPYRARLRKRVLPAPLGPWLAQLDLERALAVVRTSGDADSDASRFALLAASVACEAPADEPIARLLYRAGVAWAHEESVRGKSLGRMDHTLPEILAGRANDILGTRLYLSPLSLFVGEATIRRDFEPTPEDERRLSGPYTFRPPVEAASRR